MLRIALLSLLTATLSTAQLRPLDPAELARIRGDEARRVRFAVEQMTRRRAQFGLTADHAFELRGAITDAWGRTHVRLRQLYKGVRVLSGGAIAHIDSQDRFADPTTKLFTDIDLDATPAIDSSAARSAILTRLAEVNNTTVAALKAPPMKFELVIAPQRELVFQEDTSKRALPAVPSVDEHQWVTRKHVLAWYVTTSADETVEDDGEPAVWLVDAAAGTILDRYGLRSEDSPRNPARGPGRSLFHGAVDVDHSLNLETQQYELVDPLRGGSAVRNLARSTSFQRSAAKNFTSSAPQWGDGRKIPPGSDTTLPAGQTAAVDVLFAMARTWDFLKNVFAHEGPDGKGTGFDARVHFGEDTDVSFFHRSAKAAFFGGGSAAARQPPTDFETVAHELGHALWFSFIEAEGGANSEADGIGQGNADIVSSLAEFYHVANRGAGSSLIDLEGAWNFRGRMVNPTGTDFLTPGAANQPGIAYWTANVPALNEHAVGTLYGRLFVLLARGASGSPSNPLYSRFFPNGTAGVGIQTAANLWYVATTSFLPDEPTFLELRQAYLQAAELLHGADSGVYAATQNAFAAVGLASPVVDMSTPSVSALTVQSIDEGEGSLLVSANATDDTGVLRAELVLNGQVVSTRTRPPYGGYVDISKLSVGTHTLTLRAVDYASRVGFANAQFVVRGVNQLIADGGFELGGKWTASQGVIQTGRAAFLGNGHAALSGSATLSQQFTIGAQATEANLSFRLRIEPVETAPGSVRLEVQLRDDKGAVLQNLNSYFDSVPGAEEAANGYAKQTFNLSAYKGRTLELRFASFGPGGPPRYRVDRVSLVTTEPASVEAIVEADDGEGSIIYRLKSLSGVRAAQISRVEYWLNGELDQTVTAEPWVAVRSNQGLVRRAHTAVARVFDIGGVRILESAPVTFNVREVSELVRNGGFENGSLNWTTIGQTNFPRDTPTLARSFLGFRAALLGGRGAAHADEMLQTIEIPANATNVTLTFRLRVDSTERVSNDTLVVRAFESSGAREVTLDRFTSQTNTKGPESAKGYIKRTYDVSQYVGTSMQIFFQAKEDTGGPTSFYIDNVSMTYK